MTETEMFREDGGGAEKSRPPGSESRAGVNAAEGSVHRCVLSAKFQRVLTWATRGAQYIAAEMH